MRTKSHMVCTRAKLPSVKKYSQVFVDRKVLLILSADIDPNNGITKAPFPRTRRSWMRYKTHESSEDTRSSD